MPLGLLFIALLSGSLTAVFVRAVLDGSWLLTLVSLVLVANLVAGVGMLIIGRGGK